VIDGSVAIAVGQDAVYGIDLASGHQAWTLDRNGGPISIPAVGEARGEKMLVFLDEAPENKMSIVGVDLATMRERWRTPLQGLAVAGVTVEGTTAYTGDVEGTVYAVDLETGNLRWSAEAGSRIDGPPAVSGGRVFVAVRDATDRAVTVVALNASSGEKVWSFAPPVGSATATIPTARAGRRPMDRRHADPVLPGERRGPPRVSRLRRRRLRRPLPHRSKGRPRRLGPPAQRADRS
jgi:outer membrane protein assembly factor BamB